MSENQSNRQDGGDEQPVLFEAIYLVWRQKLFIFGWLAVILVVVWAALSLVPRAQPAKGFFQLSHQVKDFAPEASYRENKIVNLQAVLPDQAKDARGQEQGGMQNVQGVTIFQPIERKVANLSWEDAATEFFVTFDNYGLLTRAMANPALVERFLGRGSRTDVDKAFTAQVAAAVRSFKPVYAYTDERKIPNQSYRDAVNYVMGVEVSAAAHTRDRAVAAVEEAGSFLRDSLLYASLNAYFDSECRLLAAKSLDAENQLMAQKRRIKLLEDERAELIKAGAKAGQGPQSVAVGDGKLAVGGLSARSMAVETALLDARQKADALDHERKVAAVALGVFEPLKFLSDKTDSGEELYQAWAKAVREFANKSDGEGTEEVRNRLGIATRNLDYYFNDTLGFHGTVTAEAAPGRVGLLAAAGLGGLAVLLVVAYLRESFAAYLRGRRAD